MLLKSRNRQKILSVKSSNTLLSLLQLFQFEIIEVFALHVENLTTLVSEDPLSHPEHTCSIHHLHSINLP